MGRIWAAYAVELTKALRHKYTYVGPALLAVAVAVCLALRPVARDGVGDYGFVAVATAIASSLLGLIVLLVYGAGLVASEPYGALRHSLTRPVARHELLLAKAALGMTYAAVLTLTTGGTAWALAYLLGDLTGVACGGELVFPAGDMISAYVLGALLVLAPQWAAVAYALFWSTCVRNPIVAAVLAVSFWAVVDAIKYPLGIDAYLFSSYIERPWEVFAARVDGLDASWFPMAWQCLAASLGGWCVFTAAAVARFHRRDFA